MYSNRRRFSQASDGSAYFSARSASPGPMDVDGSRESSLGPRRKRARLSKLQGKRSLSSTPPESPSKRHRRFSSPKAPEVPDLTALSVKDLKDRMQALGVSFTGLVEKAELVACLTAHLSGINIENSPQNPPTPRPVPTAAASANSAQAAAAARTLRKSRGGEDAVLTEISRVEKILSRGGNFRDILGLTAVSSSAAEISSVTKKLYRLIHPDKVIPTLKERATNVFDSVRKAEAEALRQQEKRLKVKPGAVSEMKVIVDQSKEAVTVQWRMPDNVPSVARPDRFQLAAGTAGFRVEQGLSESHGDDGWYECAISSSSRKGNDKLFASRAFYFYVTPVNEAGAGAESKILVSLKEGEQTTKSSLPSFSGLTGFIRRHNSSAF